MMSEILDTASDSLSDYTKKLEIATFYTNGDEERAKQMIAGTLKDVYAIKGRFSSTSSFGAFIAFFNHVYLTLNSIYTVVSDSFALKDVKTFSDWISYEKVLADFLINNSHDDVLGRQLKNVLTSSFTIQFSSELKKLMTDRNEMEINRLFQQVLQTRLGLQSVNMVVDVEAISSLDMELNSKSSQKMMDYRVHQDEKKEGDLDIEVDREDDDKEVLKGKEVRLILRGSVILSPITGRDIGLLVVGDRLKVKITDTHPKAINVLKAFNAYDGDGPHPILGRIVYIRRRIDGGYTIYAVVAKGIYVKIEELEDNIKIAIDTSYLESESEKSRMSNINMIIIISLSVVLLLLVILLIYFFFR
jgi:hypothetical protein